MYYTKCVMVNDRKGIYSTAFAINSNHYGLLYGSEVAKAQASGKNRFTFNLENLASGVYLVTVEGTEGRFTKKLVKQ